MCSFLLKSPPGGISRKGSPQVNFRPDHILAEQLRTCRDCPATRGGICEGISDEELSALSRLAHHRTIPAGQVIFSERESPAFFANILSGTVKLTKTLADGRQQIVGILFPPDFLGRAHGKLNTCFAEAATEVELCAWPAEDFRALMARHPRLEHRLYEKALDELDAAREWMVLLGRKTAREKVASFLLMLARRATGQTCPRRPAVDEACFTLSLRRADIADYLGLTIETVSRQITRLRGDGLIVSERGGRMCVPSLAGLARAAGQEEAPLP